MRSWIKRASRSVGYVGTIAVLLVVGGVLSAQGDIRYYPSSGLAELTSSGTAITSSLPFLIPNGTAAAPGLGIASEPTTGLYRAYVNKLSWSIGSGPIVGISANGLSLGTAKALEWSSAVDPHAAADVILARDAANTLALRNGTNVQTFNIYSTYTDASNYIRTEIGRSPYFGANQGIVVDGLGTGANPSLLIGTRGTGGITFAPNGGNALQLLSTENLFIPNSAVGSLTLATMARDSTGALIRTVTSSFGWTNAQVVALGAATSGDITVATLPAKTQLLDAAVVITGQGVFAPGAYTVQCGDTGTFINYIVASDAKAAVNTFYGDAVAERGTAIDVEHYYLPSYTATTTVTCRFITAGGNLNAVTGSTGKVILTTRLLP